MINDQNCKMSEKEQCLIYQERRWCTERVDREESVDVFRSSKTICHIRGYMHNYESKDSY